MIDDLDKVVPFDHGGKPAVRAMVFRCKNGKPFVAYLQRYSEAVEAKIAAIAAAHPETAATAMQEAFPK